MPDYAPDATPRYIAKYRAAGITHTAQIRGYRGESAIAVIDRGAGTLGDIYNAITAALADDFEWLGALYIPEDSEVSILADLPAAATGLVDVADFSNADRISHLTFLGKSSLGSRCSLKLYGTVKNLDLVGVHAFTDFILTPGESGVVSATVDTLNARNVAAVDNGVVTWYQYATVKINDKWLRRLRQGTV